ncbi:MAG: biotin/lipoyl-binding protein, partial [Desulfomonile tiedjei]|nr:biotin/lipoyl-binding protein [Desulfomonile tiedjei]
MGSISCPRVLDLGFDDAGVVAEIFVEEGDQVRQGQVLAKLDSTVLEAEKASHETKLASANAEVSFFKTELAKREALYAKDAVSETELRK